MSMGRKTEVARILSVAFIFPLLCASCGGPAAEPVSADECPASLIFIDEEMLQHIPSPDLDYPFKEEITGYMPIIRQGSGVVLGFLPIVREAADGLAIVTGKDQLTGECISRLNQSLRALKIGASIVFGPLTPVKGAVKVVGKPLIGVLSRLPTPPTADTVFEIANSAFDPIVRIVKETIE